MTDFTHMPARFYKIYSNKIREMPSLKTEDIRGAQPARFHYAKGDILNKYQATQSQSVIKKDTGALNYWSSINPPMETQQMHKSIAHSSYVPYPTESYQVQVKKGVPSLFRAEHAPLHTDRSPEKRQAEYVEEYQPINNMRNSQLSAYNSGPMYPSLSAREPQPRLQVRDSLDTLKYQYEQRDPYKQNLPVEQEQNDLRQKWKNMYGMEPSENLINARGSVGTNSSLIEQESRMYKSPSASMVHDTRSYNYGVQSNMNDADFDKNKNLFFGVESSPSQPPSNYEQQQYYTRPAPKEFNLLDPLTQQPIMRASQGYMRY